MEYSFKQRIKEKQKSKLAAFIYKCQLSFTETKNWTSSMILLESLMYCVYFKKILLLKRPDKLQI